MKTGLSMQQSRKYSMHPTTDPAKFRGNTTCGNMTTIDHLKLRVDLNKQYICKLIVHLFNFKSSSS